ncbi:MAG: hypothetical protein ACYS8W_02440 [Planctomycetota bacterium]|jgi:hypothetical protein
MGNRGADAADIFSVDIGIGLGIAANVMLTKYVSFNIGVSNCLKSGTSGRYTGSWYERIVGWPASWWYIFESPGAGQTPWCTSCTFSFIIHAWARESGKKKDPMLYELRYFICGLTEEHGLHTSPYKISPWELGFSVHPVFFGTRFAFNPVEFADFLAGWFTVDFMDDDKEKPEEEESLEKKTGAEFFPEDERESDIPGE